MPSSQLSPPYPIILDGLRHGRVIPFLGSGASLGCRQAGARWVIKEDQPRPQFLPRADELSGHLANRSNFPADEPRDLAKVAQYFDSVGGRTPLTTELRAIFNNDYPCTALHTLLALISRSTPLLIVTTNYDDLIERAFRQEGRPHDLVIHTTDPKLGDHLLWWKHGDPEPRHKKANSISIDLKTTTVIYKMHGAVDRLEPNRDQYVITEDDYIDFLARMTRSKALPTTFAEPFQGRHFLFLGYSLYDWNLRVVLRRIEKDARRSKVNQDIKSWAIQHEPKLLEERFWENRGVEVYKKTIDEFLDELAASTGELATEPAPGKAIEEFLNKLRSAPESHSEGSHASDS